MARQPARVCRYHDTFPGLAELCWVVLLFSVFEEHAWSLPLCLCWYTSHQYWIRILFLLHLHQYPLPFVFLIIATLKGGEGISMYFRTGSPWWLWYKDFRCLLAICTLLCENCLSLPYIRYLLDCLILLSFCWVLYILRCQSLSNVYLARLLLHVRNFLHLGRHFFLCRADIFLISCNPICSFLEFFLELLKFFLESHCRCPVIVFSANTFRIAKRKVKQCRTKLGYKLDIK